MKDEEIKEIFEDTINKIKINEYDMCLLDKLKNGFTLSEQEHWHLIYISYKIYFYKLLRRSIKKNEI